MRFYDRENEMKLLESHYALSAKGSIMNTITGRRRIGKTRLIKEFIKDKENTFYFFVTEKESPLLLDDFREQIKSAAGYSPSFRNWDEFFDYLFKLAAERHMIAVFDEFQNFSQVDRSVFSTLQKYWDEKKDGTRMLLFCIGSYVGLMKRVFHDDKEPLYGRTTSQIRIDPMDYRNTRKILDDIGLKGEEEKITAYSIFGGVPKYYEILSMVGKKELGKTVIAAFLENGAPLAEEGNNLLVREFGGSYMTYFSILEAVSRGKCTLVEIADAIGFAPTTLGKYLFELANEYGVIVKRIPATEDEFKSKKGRYFLKDPLLKFWFEFIRKNKSAIEIGNFNVVLDQVEERIGSFIGKRYEDIVRELLIHYNNRKLKGFEISFEKMGSWWDRSGNEIDVCAFSKEKMLLGEVKWSNKMVDVDLAEALVEKSGLTGWKGRFGYLICSKAGFTERCRRFASDNDILLLDIGDLRNAFDALP